MNIIKSLLSAPAAAQDLLVGMVMESLGMLLSMRNYILTSIVVVAITFSVVLGLQFLLTDVAVKTMLINAAAITYVLPLLGVSIAKGID